MVKHYLRRSSRDRDAAELVFAGRESHGPMRTIDQVLAVRLPVGEDVDVLILNQLYRV